MSKELKKMKSQIKYPKTAKFLQDALVKKGFATIKSLAQTISEDPDCHLGNIHSVNTNIGVYFLGKRKPSKGLKPLLIKHLEIDSTLLSRIIKQDEVRVVVSLEKNSIDNLIKSLATLLNEGSIRNIPQDKLVRLIEAEISLSYHCTKMSLSTEQILLLLQEEENTH